MNYWTSWSNLLVTAFVVCSRILESDAFAARFQPGDEVILTRDEKLEFRGSFFRQGKTGERFVVLAIQPDLKKVFVSTRGKAGEQIAASTTEDALAIGLRDPAE